MQPQPSATVQPATPLWDHIIPVAIFGTMQASLLLLTFQNDEHLAAVFHSWAFAWSLFVHVAIATLPLAVAILQDAAERNVARALWAFALIVALMGNIAGSLAHAADVPLRSVLDGWPLISSGAAIAAIAGGLLLVSSEAVVGWLVERSIARLVTALAARRAMVASLQLAPPILQVQPVAPRRRLQWQRPAPRPVVQPTKPILQFPARPLQDEVADDVQSATSGVADAQPEQPNDIADVQPAPAALLPWEQAPAEDASSEDEYICPNAGCGRTFAKYQQRSAHMRHCEFAPAPVLNGH